MKTASKQLREETGIPPTPDTPTSPTQHGPEDGRDQNIRPDSHSYAPDNGHDDKGTDHNEEVYREGEPVQYYGKSSNKGKAQK